MGTSADETVIFATRFSKRLFVKPVLLAILFVAIAIVFMFTTWEYRDYCLWFFLALAAMVFVPAFSKYLLSHFVITNKRIIIKHGFIARRSYEMLLGKVESIEVDQTLSDRLLWGSGTLIITGTGGTKETFPNVGDAIKFQEHLNEILHAS
jgi:uncharacterized membrane protein YdbT with pleckstrin-like domain